MMAAAKAITASRADKRFVKAAPNGIKIQAAMISNRTTSGTPRSNILPRLRVRVVLWVQCGI